MCIHIHNYAPLSVVHLAHFREVGEIREPGGTPRGQRESMCNASLTAT